MTDRQPYFDPLPGEPLIPMRHVDFRRPTWIERRWPMIFGFIAVIGYAIVLYVAWPHNRAHGHSFYSHECCHDRDCGPIAASRVIVSGGGYLIDGHHWVPEKDAKDSPDGEFHACFPLPAKDKLRCFYRPPGSS